jgi:hypothetical protein
MAKLYPLYKTDCSKGYPVYYGVETDANGVETLTEVSQSDMLAAGQGIGCGHAGSSNYGVSPPDPGKGFLVRIQTIGKLLKLPQDVIDKYKKLAPHRGTMLMTLANHGIKVANPNNIYEVAFKYSATHPELPTPSKKEQAVTMQPKTGGGSFDWGSLITSAGNIVNTITNGINDANVQRFLVQWGQAFSEYMTNDFGEIEKTLKATAANPGAWGGWGPQGALDMFLQFNKTSWADLKATITSYCSEHSVSIPDSVVALWQDQIRLQRSLEDAVLLAQQNGTPLGGPSQTGSGNNTTIGGDPTGTGSATAGGWFKKNWLGVVIGVVAILGLVVIIVAATKSGKKKRKLA